VLAMFAVPAAHQADQPGRAGSIPPAPPPPRRLGPRAPDPDQLVGNALKFTDKEVAVSVHSESQVEGHHTVHFTVADTGPASRRRSLAPSSSRSSRPTAHHPALRGTVWASPISRNLAASWHGRIWRRASRARQPLPFHRPASRRRWPHRQTRRRRPAVKARPCPGSSRGTTAVNQQIGRVKLSRLGHSVVVAANGPRPSPARLAASTSSSWMCRCRR